MALSQKIRDLIELIQSPSIKAVCFDVFDTALLRPMATPTDLFRLIGQIENINGFEYKRILSEKRARENISDYGDEISIDDIYKEMSFLFGISLEKCELLKQLEIRLEIQLSYQRQSVMKIYEAAIASHKLIFFVSDMYLNSSTIEQMLMKNGFNIYQRVYVSSNYGERKKNGKLWSIVVSDIKCIDNTIVNNDIIVIGDDSAADCVVPKSLGIRTFYMPKTMEVFSKHRYLKTIKTWQMNNLDKSDNNIFVGLIANRLFDDPFLFFNVNSLYNAEAKKLGTLLAPFFITATLWLINNIHQNNIEQLIWIYRDGYLPEKLFNILAKDFHLPSLKCSKAYLSRAIRYPYYSLRQNGLFDSLCERPLDINMSIDDFIKYRLLEDDNKRCKKYCKFLLQMAIAVVERQ